jgi:hypothetical protein
MAVLAKSVTPSRIDENKNIIQLDSEDMDALIAIHKAKGVTRYVYPAFGVSSIFFRLLDASIDHDRLLWASPTSRKFDVNLSHCIEISIS